MGTEEENCKIIDVLNPLASGALLGSPECVVEKNLLTLGRKKSKRGLKLGETSTQFFLESLLVLLALVGRPYLCLLFRAPGLTVGLAVRRAVLTGVEFAVDLSGFSL